MFIAHGSMTVQQYEEFTGLCSLFSSFAGILMFILVFIWTISTLMFRSYGIKFRKLLNEGYTAEPKQNDSNNNNNDNCIQDQSRTYQVGQNTTYKIALNKTEQTAQLQEDKIPKNILWAQEKTRQLVKIRRSMMNLRFVILFCLAFAFLTEICATGVFWYTYSVVCDRFVVQDNCFCSTSYEHTNFVHMLRNDCPFQVESGSLLYCLSVYEPEEIKHEYTSTFTLQCQRLSGEAVSDPLCTEYTIFITWFKIMRIFLPILATIKIPMIVINMFIVMFHRPIQKVENPSFKNATWLHLDTLINDIDNKVMDPVKYYENLCATIVAAPPVEERLGPYGQEKEEERFMSIRNGGVRRGSNSQSLKGNSIQITKPSKVEFSMAPTQLLTLHKMVRYSPPDKENNTFSTPLVTKKNIGSPDFSVSQLTVVNNRLKPSSPINFTDRLRYEDSESAVNVDNETKFSTFITPARLHANKGSPFIFKKHVNREKRSSTHFESFRPSQKVDVPNPVVVIKSPSVPDLNNNNPNDETHLVEERFRIFSQDDNKNDTPAKPPTLTKPKLSPNSLDMLKTRIVSCNSIMKPLRLKSENADFASELIAAFDSKSARKEPVFQSTQKLALEDKHDLESPEKPLTVVKFVPTTAERSADEQEPFVLRSADKKPVFKLADECLSSCNNKELEIKDEECMSTSSQATPRSVYKTAVENKSIVDIKSTCKKRNPGSAERNILKTSSMSNNIDYRSSQPVDTKSILSASEFTFSGSELSSDNCETI